MSDQQDKINKVMMDKLCSILEPYPDAIAFTLAYREYIHYIDDIIDAPDRPSSEDILKLTSMASVLFTFPFWINNHKQLIIVEQLINNTYADSVNWESDEQAYRQVASDTLRHAGIDMFFAILLLTVGRDKLREFSAEFRDQCHKIQGSDVFKPSSTIKLHANS